MGAAEDSQRDEDSDEVRSELSSSRTFGGKTRSSAAPVAASGGWAAAKDLLQGDALHGHAIALDSSAGGRLSEYSDAEFTDYKPQHDGVSEAVEDEVSMYGLSNGPTGQEEDDKEDMLQEYGAE